MVRRHSGRFYGTCTRGLRHLANWCIVFEDQLLFEQDTSIIFVAGYSRLSRLLFGIRIARATIYLLLTYIRVGANFSESTTKRARQQASWFVKGKYEATSFDRPWLLEELWQ